MNKIFYFKQSNQENWLKIRESFNIALTASIRTSHFKNYDKDFEVELRETKRKPSENQRSYYFGVVLPTIQKALIEEDIFYKDLQQLDAEIREAIAAEFGLFIEEINKITGKTYRKMITLSGKGDSALVKKYIDAVIVWAAREYGIVVPEPYFKE